MLSYIREQWNQLLMLYQNPTDLKSRLIRGVTWSLIGVSIVQGLKLVAAIALARILGDVGYGELGIINSTVVTFGIFSGLGLGITATKYVAQLRNHDQLQAGQIVGFLTKIAFIAGTMMMIIIIVSSPIIADKLLDAPHLKQELRLGSILLLLNALNGVQLGALSGLEAFQAVAKLNVLEGILFSVTVTLAAWWAGLIGAIGAYVLVAVVKWIATHYALRVACRENKISLSYRNSSSNWRILWAFALPALIISLSTQPFTWLTRVILVNQPTGYAELGVFNAGFVWTTLLLFIPQQVTQPSMPILTNLFYDGQKQSFQRLVYMNLGLAIGSALIIGLPIILFAPFIMELYGSAFSTGTSTLIIVIVAYIVGAGTLVYRNVLLSTEQAWWQVLQSMIWGCVLITVAYFLISLGSIGLAIAYLVAFIVLFVVQTVHIRFKGYANSK